MPLGGQRADNQHYSSSAFSDHLFQKLDGIGCIGHTFVWQRSTLLPTMLPSKQVGIWGPGFEKDHQEGRESKPVLPVAVQSSLEMQVSHPRRELWFFEFDQKTTPC